MTTILKQYIVQPDLSNNLNGKFKEMKEKIQAKMSDKLNSQGKLRRVNDIKTIYDRLSSSSFLDDIK